MATQNTTRQSIVILHGRPDNVGYISKQISQTSSTNVIFKNDKILDESETEMERLLSENIKVSLARSG